MTSKELFNYNVKLQLLNRSWTQADLATRMNLKPPNVSIMLSNKSVYFNTIDRVCAALKCRPEDLFKRKE